MSHNPYSAPRTSIKSKNPLPWHRRVVSGFIAIPGFLGLFPTFQFIFERGIPMPERIAYGLLFATISAASFSAYFMLQRFHRYAWLPQVVVFLAFGIYYIGVLHEIGADSTIPAGAMALVIACALYSFLTRNAKPRAEYSE